MKTLLVGTSAIGEDQPVLVIAEIGVNHDGSVERALQLVDLAAASGADALKLQIFRARSLMHPSSRLAVYQERHCTDAGAVEMLRRYELPPDALHAIVDRIRARGLLPLATPFSPDDLATVRELDLAAVKIASPDLVNRPLLEGAAGVGRPLLISTGAATLDEVGTTVRWLKDWDAPFALLHCISSYPTPPGDANLCWIDELRHRFDCPVGYSDHTTKVIAGALAVAAGARVIERHLTYDRSAGGPDHAASSDPADFAEYVGLIRAAEQMRGGTGKRVLPIEQDVRSVSRQSVVVRRPLPAGARIVRDDLTVQRPGTGISASLIQSVIGRRAAVALEAGTMLQWEMIGGIPSADSSAAEQLKGRSCRG